MKTLELSDDEAKTLEPVIARFLTDMDREIARTDKKEFRDELKKEEEVLKGVAARLKGRDHV